MLYAQRLFDNLDPAQHEIHILLSNYAQAVVSEELPGGFRLPSGARTHNLKSMNAPFASGSNPPDAMVVIPLDFFRLPLIALIGWLFYAETLDPMVFAGAGLIIVGVL